MYDPEEDDPQKQAALDAAKPGKYGATQQDLSRLASMALQGKSSSLPEGKSYSSIATDSPGHGIPEGKSYTTLSTESPDKPGDLADMYEKQAEFHKAQPLDVGPVPKEADDSPSPTVAQAEGKGKPGEFGATASDLMSLA